MWTSSVAYILPLIFVLDAATSSTIANCRSYYNGCNWCGGTDYNDAVACTGRHCPDDEYTAQICLECNDDMVWLTTDEKTSECGCPQGEELSNGECIISGECPDASEQLLRCNFPEDDEECEYEYKICETDSVCGEGYRCDIRDESTFYDECVPLMCKLDTECNPYDCINDCVGIGYGTCVKVETAAAAEEETAETDENQYCGLNFCLNYYDGCNWCQCDPETGNAACTLRMCFTNTAEICSMCEDDMVWLATDEQTSECGCPQGEEISNGECVISGECPDASEQLLRCNFPEDASEVEYDYRTCYSDDNCDDGYRCEIPNESTFYDECTPLMCKLDAEGNTYDCIDDCVGIGYGTCVKDITSTLCDNVPFCRSYNDGCNVEDALNECTMDVCMDSIKSNLCTSESDCNDGFECKTLNFTNIVPIEGDRCLSFDCGEKEDLCNRYSCLDMCGDNTNSLSLKKCIRKITLPEINIPFGNNNCNCTNSTDTTSKYCCSGTSYNSACEAKCDGISDVNSECTQGECEEEEETSANHIDLLGLGNKNKKLIWNAQHNYVIVGIQLIILSLCCLSVGLAMSFCGFSYKKQFKYVENADVDDLSMNELSEL